MAQFHKAYQQKMLLCKFEYLTKCWGTNQCLLPDILAGNLYLVRKNIPLKQIFVLTSLMKWAPVQTSRQALFGFGGKKRLVYLSV